MRVFAALVCVIGISAAIGSGPVSAQDAAAPAASAPAVACEALDQEARVVKAVPPVVPPEARTISGLAIVIVSLDENSRIVSAQVANSPAAVLNIPALFAARASTFQTAVRDCKPIASTYNLRVMFTATASVNQPPPSISDYFVGTWYCTSDRNNLIVNAYGLSPNGSALIHIGAFVAGDRSIGSTVETYTATGPLTTVTSRFEGRTTILTSNGWAGDTLAFNGLASTGQNPALPASAMPGSTFEYMTYTRIDKDHFLRVFESAPDPSATFTTNSRETCARIAAPPAK
jgi:hypothetical protein